MATVGTNSEALKYTPGSAYSLTVAVLGGGGGMSNRATLDLSFYYVESPSNRVTIASTSVTNTKSLFPTNTSFVDFEVVVPTVQGTLPWGGKPVGVRIASTVGFGLQGGYWDLDNVRLRIAGQPNLAPPVILNNVAQVTVNSTPGFLELLTSSDIGQPLSSWNVFWLITNLTGSVTITDTNTTAPTRFYQVRKVH